MSSYSQVMINPKSFEFVSIILMSSLLKTNKAEKNNIYL